MQYFTETNSHVAEILHAWLSSCQKRGFCFDLFFVLSCSPWIVWSQGEDKNPCPLAHIFFKDLFAACIVMARKPGEQRCGQNLEHLVPSKSQQQKCEQTLSAIVDPRFQCTKKFLHWAEHQLLCSVLALCAISDVLSLRSELTSLALSLLLLGEIMDYNQGLTSNIYSI